MSDPDPLRALLTPALDWLRLYGELDGALPADPLAMDGVIPIRFVDGVEVPVTASAVKRRRAKRHPGLPLVQLQIGTGKGATTHTLVFEGETIAPILADFLRFHHRRAAAGPPPGPTAEVVARRINAAYRARPGRGAQRQALGVEVIDGELVVRIWSMATAEQAHIMLAAARVSGLLGQKSGKDVEAMATALSTLWTALAAHGTTPAR